MLLNTKNKQKEVNMTEKDKFLTNIATLNLELHMLIREQVINERLTRICKNSIDYFHSEIRILDLVEFCNTGKYPNESR